MHRIIVLIILNTTLVLFPKSSLAQSMHYINITCWYFKEFRTHIGEVQVCFVLNDQSIMHDDTYISTISDGNYTLTKDLSVKHFATLDKSYQYMPQGLSDVFGMLKGLEFVHSKLKVLRQKDMQPHEYLEYLNLRGNDIECVDGDVFYYNPRLKFISLADNKIKRIDTQIFESLGQIEHFWINGNHCNAQKVNSRYYIGSLKEDLMVYCSPSYSKNKLLTCEEVVEFERRKYIEMEDKYKNPEKLNSELPFLATNSIN